MIAYTKSRVSINRSELSLLLFQWWNCPMGFLWLQSLYANFGLKWSSSSSNFFRSNLFIHISLMSITRFNVNVPDKYKYIS